MGEVENLYKNQQIRLQKISPRPCFLVSRASSVANKVFGKRMKILDLKMLTGNDQGQNDQKPEISCFK